MAPLEYLRLLHAVVNCMQTHDPQHLNSATAITDWLHALELEDIQVALATSTNFHSVVLREVLHCINLNTHDPRVPNWTPDQFHFWFSNVQEEHVREVLLRPPQA